MREKLSETTLRAITVTCSLKSKKTKQLDICYLFFSDCVIVGSNIERLPSLKSTAADKPRMQCAK